MSVQKNLFLTAALAAVLGGTLGCNSASSVDPPDDGSKPKAPVDPKTLTPPSDLPKSGPKGGKH